MPLLADLGLRAGEAVVNVRVLRCTYNSLTGISCSEVIRLSLRSRVYYCPYKLTRSSFPLHRRLADELREGIVSGVYPAGSQLPSEHELARRHGIARSTVRHALETLRSEGAIAAQRGTRRVVLGEPLTQSFSELISFSTWARSLGEKPGGRVVRLVRRPATENDSATLALGDGADVFDLVRVRLLGETPVMVERSTFVEEVGSLLGAVQLEQESIYERLAELGIVFARARHTIDAVSADAEDARLLSVPRRTPLLRQRRRSTATDGRPLEWSDDRYRGDAVAFVVDNAAGSSQLGRLLAQEPDEGRRVDR